MSLTTSGGIRVTGAWTRAGLGSCVRVQGLNRFDDIIFDCGVCEPECLKAGFVFISHGHVDHIGASVMHARAKMLTSSQSIYYVPVESVGPLEEARIAFSKMDGKDIPMNIVPLQPGDSVNVNSDLIVRVFPTIHRVPSQGYALYKRTSGSLLQKYSNLPGNKIGELRRAGVKITEDDTESLELVYTGDTVFEGLMLPSNHFIFRSAILILELTYLDGDKTKAVDRGHIHLDDIVQNAHMFQNQQIVFVHLSERYGPHSKALNMLKEGLPSEILERSVVSLRSFGSGEHLTKISTVDWNKRRAEVGWGWGRQVKPSHGHQDSRGGVGGGSDVNAISRGAQGIALSSSHHISNRSGSSSSVQRDSLHVSEMHPSSWGVGATDGFVVTAERQVASEGTFSGQGRGQSDRNQKTRKAGGGRGNRRGGGQGRGGGKPRGGFTVDLTEKGRDSRGQH